MTQTNMSILTDVTKCIGCDQCVAACQEVNELPPERPWRWLTKITDLSSARWTTLVRVDGDAADRFVRRHCRHCLEPACVEACIVGALTKSPEGPVVYDRDLCIGCRYCMIACPFEIPRYSWEDTVPYVQKCDLCYERVQTEGKPPACVEACPTQATIFGEREEMLAEARKRLAAEPDKYIQHIWGEREVGGTSVLYVSDVNISLTDLDTTLSESSETPMPQRTFKILRHMPTVFVEMAAVMGGVYWIIERREKLANERATGALESGGADAEGREGEADAVDSEGDDGRGDSPQAKQS
jgi:formate dehydrogenase iron-sulfur subunit